MALPPTGTTAGTSSWQLAAAAQRLEASVHDLLAAPWCAPHAMDPRVTALRVAVADVQRQLATPAAPPPSQSGSGGLRPPNPGSSPEGRSPFVTQHTVEHLSHSLVPVAPAAVVAPLVFPGAPGTSASVPAGGNASAEELAYALEASLAHYGWQHIEAQQLPGSSMWTIGGVPLHLRIGEQPPVAGSQPFQVFASEDAGRSWEALEDVVRRRRLQKVVRTVPIVVPDLPVERQPLRIADLAAAVGCSVPTPPAADTMSWAPVSEVFAVAAPAATSPRPGATEPQAPLSLRELSELPSPPRHCGAGTIPPRHRHCTELVRYAPTDMGLAKTSATLPFTEPSTGMEALQRMDGLPSFDGAFGASTFVGGTSAFPAVAADLKIGGASANHHYYAQFCVPSPAAPLSLSSSSGAVAAAAAT